MNPLAHRVARQLDVPSNTQSLLFGHPLNQAHERTRCERELPW
jgi:hypothetical protein